ncbi:MAG: hypothetical protein GAK43_00247 [Stenotrophomonas maltophilia]|nr:MAG: hypothetical protein GAK43_00247 [Stenotrophomonas maltophilia]
MRKCGLLFLTWMAVAGGMDAARAASPLLPQHEQYKKIKAAETLAPLTSELFGDRVNLSSGSTEFVVTDIDLPGNNALPVKLQRRLVVQSFLEKTPVGGFGAWDIEVPYLHGTFDYMYKWDVGANATQRCSQRFTPKTRSGILIWEIFTGYSAHLPGEGDQSMLYIGGAGRTDPKPSDGVVYNWGTRNNMRLTCLPGTTNGYPGEGFLGVDSQGNRYFFNVGQERAAGNLTIAPTVATNLVKVLLMASRVEDRYGNWVAYDYSGNKVTGIRSSDGRSISIEYSGDRIVGATANGRTWRYEYDEPGHWAGFAKWARLKSVIQPDGARWTYQYGWQSTESGGLSPSYGSWDGDPSTCHQVMFEPDSFTLQATHPAGTQGLFEFKYSRRGRIGVPPRACGTQGGPNGRYVQRVKASFDVYALVRKTLSGPGIGAQVWSFERGGYVSGIPNTTVATVVEPDGTRKHSVYGIKLDENEGQLLAEAVSVADGSIVKQVRNTYVGAAEAAQLPFPDNYGEVSAADDAFARKVRPLKAVAMSQDGVDFSRSTEQFDAFARSVIEAESNSLGYARMTNTTFFDDTGRWILGQVARQTLTVSGVETETARTEFDALSRPQRMFSFGLLQQSAGYHADGNIASLADANGNTILLNSWKRGLPQQVSFPDGSSSQATVDDNGWVRSLVEPNGAHKGYDYDDMGRIVLATQAASDSVA